MLRIDRTAAVGALMVLALATASHRAVAQDTSNAGQSPRDTSAYTGGVSRDTTDTSFRTGVERVDSTALPGPGAGMGDTTTDTSAAPRTQPRATQPSAADSTDTTRIGQTASHRTKHAHRRLHPADSTQATGAATGQTASVSDTVGMAGRRSSDSIRAGQEQSPEPAAQPGTSSDSSSPSDSTAR
jgi:hypothetical protein